MGAHGDLPFEVRRLSTRLNPPGGGIGDCTFCGRTARRNSPIALTAQAEPRRCVYPGPDTPAGLIEHRNGAKRRQCLTDAAPAGLIKHGTAACTIETDEPGSSVSATNG